MRIVLITHERHGMDGKNPMKPNCSIVLSQVFRSLAGALIVTMVAVSLTDTILAEESVAREISPEQKIQNGSPEILADGKVVFRLRSGSAKAVVARGQFGPEVALVKGENDQWEGTTAAAVAGGIYEYQLVVDGVALPDPLNRWIKPQRWPSNSILHVPSNPPAPWDFRHIAHGAVHRHTYWSESLGTWRQLVVASPAGMKPGDALPVLYLSHGFSDTEETWTVHGRSHFILDSLIAEKRAVPMLLVMPDAHALPPSAGRGDGYAAKNTDAFAREMISEVIPLVEKLYPVRAEPSARAFAGLSMGGRHALTIALRHSDQFSHIGAFSSAVPDQPTLEATLPGATDINSRLSLLWVACGKEDFLFQQNETLHAAFEKAGLRHQYVVTEGNHSWPVWRRYLVDFLPLLFQARAQ
jgi:enterochelin esterase-like enzyme